MAELKHVGKLKNNNRKCIIAYRVVPGEPENCIVIPTESLDADQHDSLIKLVESNAGQTAYELADAMNRTVLPDGRNMLSSFHLMGKFIKVPTDSVIMVPNGQTSIVLSELNQIIADQRGVSIEDLALKPTNAGADTKKEAISEEAAVSDVLTDEQLAAQYRSQADAMYKEAKRLREQAEELVPTKKKVATKAKASA